MEGTRIVLTVVRVALIGASVWVLSFAAGWIAELRPFVLASYVSIGGMMGWGFGKLLQASRILFATLFVGLLIFGGWITGALDYRAYYLGVVMVGGALIYVTANLATNRTGN